MSSSSESLRQQKRDLDEAQAAIGRALKHARQQQKNEQKAQAKSWQLSSFLLHAVLIIYGLSGYAAQPAATFLLNNGRRRHWPDKSQEELEEMVEALFMKCDIDDFTKLTNTQEPQDMAAMKAALSYVEQWRLVQWVSQMNEAQGIAPSTGSVLQRYEEQRQELPDEVRPAAVGVPAQTSARVWAGSFRRRWGGKHGRIPVREQIPIEELRSKVATTTRTTVQETLVRKLNFAFPFWERRAFLFRERVFEHFFEVCPPPPGQGRVCSNWVTQLNPRSGHTLRSQNGNVFLNIFMISRTAFSHF